MNAQAIDNGRGARCCKSAPAGCRSAGSLARRWLPPSRSFRSRRLRPGRRKRRRARSRKATAGSSVSAYCEQRASPDAETCEAALISCCGLLKGCDAAGFYDCLIDGLIALEA